MIICIAGPTASGKSDFAWRVAKAIDGIVINTDSMQVYKELPVLTAQPKKEYQTIPHYLYGHVSMHDHYSVAQWLKDVCELFLCSQLKHKNKIFVGGSGLYFWALLNGISYTPQVTVETKQHIEKLWVKKKQEGLELYDLLYLYDENMAKLLHNNDHKRIRRALEIRIQTGRSLLYWQKQKKTSIIPKNETPLCFFLNPKRTDLYARINRRFCTMLDNEVMSEIECVYQGQLPSDASVRQILGLNYLYDFYNKDIDLKEACSLAQRDTRRYAKRQWSWARKHMISWQWLEEEEYTSDEIINSIVQDLKHSESSS